MSEKPFPRELLDKMRRLIGLHRERPQDPWAYRAAPKKPRKPNLSGAAVADRPDEHTGL